MPHEPTTYSKAMTAALPIGSIIGRKYRIDEVIAEGGMGIVYKGWHLVLDHPIAIKVVRPEYAYHPEAAARFVNEARASAQLNGIHSAHVLDLGRIENGPPVMVLEYLDGCDLRRVLDTSGPLALDRAVDYVLQTCEAVAEGHSRGIIHRDLKPENLFITRMPDGSEILKVIDFGISKRLGSVERSYTVQNQAFGSPDYMAPEQMSTPDQVDARADIWSIGIVLFELLTNSVPFGGETVQVTCVKVMCDEPIALRSLRPDVPEEVERIVLRCLQKLPEERYPSVMELAQDLVAFASPAYAQSFGRVRHLLSGGAEDGAESPTSGSMRVLSWHGPMMRDVTPLPPPQEASDTEHRVPLQPLWPVALSIAAAAMLIVLTVSNPHTIRTAASSAVERVETVTRNSARALGGWALSAARLIYSANPASATSSERLGAAAPWASQALGFDRFAQPPTAPGAAINAPAVPSRRPTSAPLKGDDIATSPAQQTTPSKSRASMAPKAQVPSTMPHPAPAPRVSRPASAREATKDVALGTTSEASPAPTSTEGVSAGRAPAASPDEGALTPLPNSPASTSEPDPVAPPTATPPTATESRSSETTLNGAASTLVGRPTNDMLAL